MAIMSSAPASSAHTAGIFADMTLDGPEIGTLVAVIDRARNLPNRRTMGKQDPYCAMRLGKEAKKTETDRRGGQTPKWDQELRFTVHESPDYYKIKCSVFNDDKKKTDMIGEAWVDLREVIIPGGGQNDLWHQLQFKGKYAGEIRMELTYYDTRPKDETILEKRREKQRNNSQSTIGVGGEVGGRRQIGPREITRRPLPPSPAASSPSQAPQRDSPQTSTQPLHAYGDIPIPRRGSSSQTLDGISSHPESSEPYAQPSHREQARPYNAQYKSPYEDFELPSQEQMGDDRDFVYNSEEKVKYHQYSSPADFEAPLSQPPYSNSNYGSDWDEQQRVSPSTRSPAYCKSSIPANPPRYSSPSAGQLPPLQTEQRASSAFKRYSTSPIKNIPFRDSPLRQSVSHQDVMAGPDVEDEDAPPPPPAHRESSARPSLLHHTDDSRSSYEPPRPSGLPSPRSLLEAQSPLQAIERNYDRYQSSPPVPFPHSSRQRSYDNRPVEITSICQDQFRHSTGSFVAPNGQFQRAQPPRSESNDERQYCDEPQPLEEDFRRRSDGPYQPDDRTAPCDRSMQRHHQPVVTSFENDRNVYSSSPQVFRPRAISPNPHGVPAPQSISPNPSPSVSRDRLTGVPFGPDAYEAINPVQSSPVTSLAPLPAEMSTLALEEARQLEVERLRDQGPIIGNDGREIDPSDHLPSDTWAPEPERKTRKPEVVIRFKTKDEVHRRPAAAGSFPASARPQSYAGPSYASPQPISSTPESPAVRTGRNRLQKQTPNRPLLAQPFQHTHSSPAVPQQHMPSRPLPNQPYQHANSSPSVPMSEHRQSYQKSSPRTKNRTTRPALSEYSINASDTEDFLYLQQLPPVSGMIPIDDRSLYRNYPGAGDGPYDSLSMELSTIDIGPPRGRGGGRTGLRSSRGYGGY